MTAIKEIHKRWAIYTDSQSSMQSIDNNKENNHIYDILAELQAQDKKITMCKVHTHIASYSSPNGGTPEKNNI